MMNFISVLLVTLAVIVVIPAAVFLVEVIAAIAQPRRDLLVSPNGDVRGRIAVLVPAHNESAGLLPTLADIKAQMRAADRLLVVADNCTDDTAAVAAAAGAEVLSRIDLDKRGKGYALASGLRHLSSDPPDIVIVIDADCRLADGGIDRLASTCKVEHRPVQALYLMNAPSESSINYRVVEFAWRVRNSTRPLGLRAFGLPCQLMGTGMAFPWDVICMVDLENGSIVEDLKLGLDLALAGHAPLFCPSTSVSSDFPFSVEGIETQRSRWEQGHISLILTTAPRLIFAAMAKANVDLLALALDAAVPPLSLLGLMVLGMLAATGLATALGVSSVALFITTVSFVGFVTGVCLAWLKCGRDILPPRAILSIVPYAIGKLPLYGRMLSGKSESKWVRTDRRKI
jgi:cellulose synthase/poly-beta-1,6-N-acetylglucosamine synthase-like glycosyltransferase